VAKQLGMEIDDPTLAECLSEMDFDYNWDEAIAQERVFKKKGEKRYFFSKRKFDLLKSIDSKKQQTTTSAEKKCKQAPALPSSSSSKVEIKLENPEHFQCKKSVEVLNSSEAKVQGQLGIMERLSSQLEAFGTTDALAKRSDIEGGLKALRAEHKAALKLVAGFKFVPKDAEKCIDYKSSVEGAIRDLSAHLDAAQLLTKKGRLWLEAMAPAEEQ